MKNRFIKHSTLMILLLPLSALEAKSTSLPEELMNWAMSNIILVLAGIVILATLFTLFALLNNLLANQKRAIDIAQGFDVEALENSTGPSFFERLYAKSWSLVPMDKEADIDLGHEYDGIRELDNKLPPWWLYLFYITIAWAVVYVYVSHFREDSISQAQEYEIAMEEAELQKERYLAGQANSIDESNVVFLTDVADLESGKKIYMTNCLACHGAEGQGGIGPNLTDKYWIHGGGAPDIFKTIKYGVVEKGMTAWQASLPPVSIQRVASFIHSLEGTDPPNAKEPQGELYEAPVMTMNSSELN